MQQNLRRSPSSGTFAEGAFYVFNADGDNGFVIVSADDRTTAILGYADTGSLDLGNLPENAAWWLQSYASQIKSLGSAVNLAAPLQTPGAEVVAPLMTCKWDQPEPYNNQCPKDSNGKCYTGCVATAMAQVIRYYQWPKSVGALPAYTSLKKDGDNDIAMDALPATSFDWNKLKDTYVKRDGEPQYTEDEANEVAKLMRYCGQSIKMQYGSRSSSGNIHVATMVNYFGFSKTAREIIHIGFGAEEWEKLIYDELTARRVVLYGGGNESGAHQFVIDGFDGKGLFHVNWGWNGDSDGYFVIRLLNPDGRGIGGGPSGNGYSQDQSAIIGLKIPEDGDVAAEPVVYHHLELAENAPTVYSRTSASENFKDVRCGTSFIYSGIAVPTIDYRLEIWQNGIFKEVVLEIFTEKLMEDKSQGWQEKLTFCKNYADGTYEVRVSYRINGTEAWKAPRYDVQGKTCFVTIKGNQLTIAESANTVTINSVDIKGDCVTYRPMTATVSWTRPADNDINENAFYVWMKGADAPSGSMSSVIAKGETEVLVISFRAKKTGTYTLYLSSDYDGKKKIYDIPGTYTFKAIKKQDLNMNWDDKNINGTEPNYILEANEFHPKVTIQNEGANAYDDYVILQLTPVDANGQPMGDKMIVRKQVSLAAGASLEDDKAIQGDFTALTDGQRYEFCTYHYTNENDGNTYYKWILQVFFTVKSPTGIHAVEATDKADAPVYNMMGQRVGKSQKGLVICKGRKYMNR